MSRAFRGEVRDNVPLPATATPQASYPQPAKFSFDDVKDPLEQPAREVKVTGDNEIKKFEDQCSDISGTLVSIYALGD